MAAAVAAAAAAMPHDTARLHSVPANFDERAGAYDVKLGSQPM